MGTRFDLLIATIPHRHAALCRLLAELDGQMLSGAGVLLYRDNLTVSYGPKCQALLDASAADYVAFLDDDDWVRPNYLGSILAALDSDPDFVGCPAPYYENGNLKETFVLSLYDRSAQYPGENTVRGRAGIAHKNPIRRDLALLGTWSGGFGADGDWGRQVRDTGRVQAEAWIGEPIYEYRWVSGDSFSTPRPPFAPQDLPALPCYPWLTVLDAPGSC